MDTEENMVSYETLDTKEFLDATASLDYRMSVSDTFGSKHYTLEN